MSTTFQPVVSDVADLFWWKVQTSIASNSAVASANEYSDQIKILPGSFFVFVAWRGITNYDSVVELRAPIGASPGTAATALYPAAVPNNFSAFVRKNNKEYMMDKPMPQAALCSTGYRAGGQVPIPVIYPPSTTFNITVFNTAPVILTAANQTTAIPLVINFGLFGYNVPVAKLSVFLASWGELYGKAIAQLTRQNI